MIAKYFQNLTISICGTKTTSMSGEDLRKIGIFLILSILAGVLLIIYGSYDLIYIGDKVGPIAFGAAILLLLNVLHAWIYKNFEHNILFGVGLISALFTFLYWQGNATNVRYLWYLAFPGFAAFSLGSKKGSIVMGLMVLPILFSHFFSHSFSFIKDYSLSFEARFLGAYSVMCYQALLFNNNAEKNQTELMISNEVLERTVVKRTADLIKQNSLLAEEVAVRTKAEAQVNQTLAEKEILFREVHHRTKNNMNVIISLLNLQKRELSADNIEGVFQQISDRIQSMALVHEQLYQSENVSTINFGNYLSQLVNHIKSAHNINHDKFILNLNQQEVLVGLQQAVPLGLALNEILTNAFKHAKPKSGRLQLDISLSQLESENIIIEIADNGGGLPSDFDLKKASSLGLHLIQILIVDQLDGKVQVHPDAGVRYHITIPIDDEPL